MNSLERAEFAFLNGGSPTSPWFIKTKKFLNAEEIEKTDMSYAYEIMKENGKCRPIKAIFDYELYLEEEPEDIEEYLEKPLEVFKSFDMFNDNDILDNIAISNYSRWDNKKNKYKVSFHFVMPNIKTCYHKLEDISNVLKKMDEGFDIDAYKGGLMRWCLGRKPDETSDAEPEIIQGEKQDFILGIIDEKNIKFVSECESMNKKETKPKTEKVNKTIKDDNIKRTHIQEFIKRCYTKQRATDYGTWFKVCCGLIYSFGEDAFELCEEFSKISYEGNNDKIYENILNRVDTCSQPITDRSLYFMAKEDNYEEYKKIMNEYPLINFEDWSHNGLAKLIKQFKPDEFLYKDNDLYCFNGKFWVKDQHILSHYISNEFKDLLKMYNSDCFDKGELIQNFKKLNQMGNNNFKKGIIEQCRDYFLNNDVEFDNQPHLIGFNNLVYDLNINKFREYKTNDYVSMTCGYDWEEPSEEVMTEMTELLKKIFPNADVLECVKHILTTGLYGRCLENFTLFNGSGGNGKGVLSSIIKKALGSYYGDLNNKVLTEPIKEGGNPELANLKGKRMVFSREPDANIGLNNATIKELTGDTTIKTRQLFSNNNEIVIPATFILECNKRPKFSSDIEDADIRRLIDIEFPNRFTNRKELIDDERVFKADPKLKSKETIDKFKYALMRILFNFNKSFEGDIFNVQLPKVVQTRTDDYLSKGSLFMAWFHETFEKTEMKDEYLSISDVFNEYKSSETYKNLTRNEKKGATKASLIDMFSKSVFFFKDYKERAFFTSSQGTRTQARNILMGWRVKEECDILEIETESLGG